MKNLTWEALHKAPALVYQVRMCSMMGIPIGLSLYEEALEKHPEYFPEEVEHLRKWNSVPEKLKDEHYEESRAIDEKFDVAGPPLPNKGLMHMITNSEGQKELEVWRKYNADTYEEREKEKRDLYNRYFNKFGLKK